MVRAARLEMRRCGAGAIGGVRRATRGVGAALGGAAESIAAETGEKLPTDAPVLAVGLEGTLAEVDWQVQALCDEIRSAGVSQLARVDGPAVAKLWSALTEYRTTAEEPLTFKANLPPSRVVSFAEGAARAGARVQAHAGNGIVWGHLPDGITNVTAARTLLEPLLAQARGGGGNLVVVDCDPAWKTDLPVFGAPEAGVPLMTRLKQKFDPDHLLNPGRFFAGSVSGNRRTSSWKQFHNPVAGTGTGFGNSFYGHPDFVTSCGMSPSPGLHPDDNTSRLSPRTPLLPVGPICRLPHNPLRHPLRSRLRGARRVRGRTSTTRSSSTAFIAVCVRRSVRRIWRRATKTSVREVVSI